MTPVAPIGLQNAPGVTVLTGAGTGAVLAALVVVLVAMGAFVVTLVTGTGTGALDVTGAAVVASTAGVGVAGRVVTILEGVGVGATEVAITTAGGVGLRVAGAPPCPAAILLMPPTATSATGATTYHRCHSGLLPVIPDPLFDAVPAILPGHHRSSQ